MFRKWSVILLQADDNQSVSWYVSRWWVFRKVASCRWVGVLVVGRLVEYQKINNLSSKIVRSICIAEKLIIISSSPIGYRVPKRLSITF